MKTKLFTNHTITVMNSSELVTALADENHYDVIYLGADISLNAPAGISNGKTRVIIDGYPPAYAGGGRGYTLNQSASGNTIQPAADNLTTNSIIFRNMVITTSSGSKGIFVTDDSRTGLTVRFDNIDFTGTQAVTNVSGTSVLRNGIFNIVKGSLLDDTQRLGDMGFVIMEDEVTVITSGIQSPLIRFPNQPAAFTVKVGARVNITATSTWLFTSGSGVYPAFSFEAGSSFHLACWNGFGNNSNRTGDFTIGPDASVFINQNIGSITLNTFTCLAVQSGYSLSLDVNAGFYATITTGIYYATGITTDSLTLGSGASLIIDQSCGGTLFDNPSSVLDTGGSIYLAPGSRMELYHRKGALAGVTGGQAVQLNQGAALIADSPQRMVIYSELARAIRTSSGTNLSFTAHSVNRWTSEPSFSGSHVTTVPNYIWSRAGTDPIVISAQGAGSSITGTNYSQGGIIIARPDNVPGNSNFNPNNANMVSIGTMPLTIDDIYETSTSISGAAPGDSALQAAYTGQSGSKTVTGTASGLPGSGWYQLSLGTDRASQNSSVEVRAEFDKLYAISRTQVQGGDDPGYLKIISAPDFIQYGQLLLPAEDTLFSIEEGMLEVLISDMRVNRTPWYLTVNVTGPLAAPNGHTIPEALVFLSQEGTAPVPLDTSPVIAYVPDTYPEGQTAIRWNAGTGILLRLGRSSKILQSGSRYSTGVIWTLMEGTP